MASSSIRVRWGHGGAYDGSVKRLADTLINETRMREAGLYLAVQIERRTQSGRDESGRRFRPYTAAYATQKNVRRGEVTLTRSGEMFRAFTVTRVTRNSVRIGFATSAMADRARYNEGMGRRFLGINPRWLAEVKRRLAGGLSFIRT